MIRYTEVENGGERDLHPLHRAVEFGAQFDWVTPAIALIGQLSGNLVQLATPLASWGETYALLRGGGVRIVTTQSTPALGVMLFTVSAKHAKRAAQLLGGGMDKWNR
jgi:hypothetical protein